MPFGHWYDLIPLLLIAVLLFGAKRLPEIGSSIGKTIKEFQRSMRDVTDPQANDAALPPAATRADATALPSASSSATEGALTGSTSATTNAEPIKN